MEINKRFDEIDILKALGIIMMLAGHSGMKSMSFFYLFHMAIFFIASGYCFKLAYSNSKESVLEFIKRKIKHLFLPYAIFNMFFVLTNNICIKLNILSTDNKILNYLDNEYCVIDKKLTFVEMIKESIKGFFGIGYTTLGAPMWFIVILFAISVIYCINNYIVNRIFKKNCAFVQTIISIVFLFIGFFFNKSNISIFGYSKVFSYYILFHIGTIIRRYEKVNIEDKYYLFLLLFSGILLFLLKDYGRVSLNVNEYTDPIYLIIVSILGWFFTYSISWYINRTILRNIFIRIGKNTLPILILHCISFKIPALIVIFIYKLPLYCLAGSPRVYGDKGLWWILYIFIGIVVPIFVYEVYIKVKNCTATLKVDIIYEYIRHISYIM